MRKKGFIIVAVILAAIILTIGLASCDIGKSGSTGMKHTVTFDVNGGNETYSSKEYEAGVAITDLPTPTRNGYVFDCWRDSEGNEYSNGFTMPDKDIVLIAQWISSGDVYTVNFDINGGNEEINSQIYAVGDVMKNLPTPEKDGYRFVCWVDNLGNEYDATSIMPAENLTLKAQWEKVVTKYDDNYVSLKPASEGYKSSYYYNLYRDEVNVFVYVELTSDDLGGVDKVGKDNNFTLRTLDGMEYKVNSGYTWTWYQGNFQTPNGAQRFTLDYGSNIQLVTVSDGSGVVVRTYLVDLYVRHDYYVSLYSSIFAQNPYDKVRVIENERFPLNTGVKELEGFEFEDRVYYNNSTSSYESYVYSTAVRSDINLYQTYKTVNVPVVDEEGNSLGSVDVKPFEQYLNIQSINKSGYDLIGYRIDDEENGKFFTDVTGLTGRNYFGRNDGALYFDSLTAVYSAKRYYQSYIDDKQTVSVVNTYPVIIYTDETQRYIKDIIYVPENCYSKTPDSAPYKGKNYAFKGWSQYRRNQNTGAVTVEDYSFNKEVTGPVAIFASFIYYTVGSGEDVVSLDQTKTCYGDASCLMYIPVAGTYRLYVSTSTEVTFTVSAYLSQEAKTYTATLNSPVEVEIDYTSDSLIKGGNIVITAISANGYYEVTLEGPNAEENPEAVEMTEENTIVYGEEAILLDPNGRVGYAYYCTDESNNKILSYIDKWNYADGQDFVCDFDEYVAQNCTLTFDTNGGNEIAPITQATDSALSLPIPEKEGYYFVGWFTEKVPTSFESQFALNKMPGNNTTLYAGWASEEIKGKFTYEINDGKITVTKYLSGSEIIIPETLFGLQVTAIGDSAFSGCKSIVSVSIPDSVNKIGSKAFYNCSLLSNVNIPSGVSMIDSYMFYNCKSLKRIILPDSITILSDYAFYGCSSLSDIILPDSVRTIKSSAFEGCISFTKLIIRDTLTTIGAKAFKDCSSLVLYCEAAYKPSGWDSDWNSSNCPVSWGYEYVTVDDIIYGVKSGEVTVLKQFNDFSGALELPSTIDYNDKTYSVSSIGDNAFSRCSSLTSITIPDSVTSIGSLAFYNCSSLTSITIPDSVTSIGSAAFSGCSSLESITLPFIGAKAGVTSSNFYQYPLGYIFGTVSYTGGTSVKQSYYGSSTSTTTYSYYYIPSKLKSVTVTGGTILYGAFQGCNMLLNVVLEEGVKSISSNAFDNCISMISVTIAESVRSIGNKAFYGCSSLTSVTFGENNKLESIGESAFYNCTSLTSITISDSVTSIGSYAFQSCSSLTIYCEVASKPSDWNSNWNYSNCPVVWDCKNSDVANNGNVYYVDENGIRYALKDGNATVVRQIQGLSGDIEIPSSISYNDNVYEVASVGSNAFYNCSSLTSITIPDSVTSIGSYAFYNCSSLKSVYITDIEAWCNILFSSNDSNPLYYAHNLYVNGELVTELVIPESVTSIGSYAFSDCSSLTSVTFGENSKLESIGWCAFYNCRSLTSISIPDSVTSIGSSAFSGCSSLKSITLPFIGANAGVTSSDTYQYPLGYIFGTTSYTGGTSVKQSYYGSSTSSTTSSTYYIPSTLRSVTVKGGNILYGAFYNCSRITSVTIGDGVTSIGSYAFYNCSSLKSVYITDIEAWCNISFSDSYSSNPLYYAHNLYLNGEIVTELVIPESVTSIGSAAFSGCSSLTSITIPDSVTSIGTYAFYNCSSLTSITIPDSITSIGSDAFYGSSSLTSVTFSENIKLESIGERAFYNCRSLTSISIPDSVTSIGTSAFSGCGSLESITLPFIGAKAGVTSSDTYQYPLGYIFGTSSYTGGKSVKQYYYGSSTSSTTSSIYYIPSTFRSVTVTGGNILYGAFYNCGMLTSVTIGDDVTSIGSYAFIGCGSLTSVTFSENSKLESIGESAFYECSLLTSITIPDSVTSIGAEAFYECSSLTSITIGDSVTNIGDWAFYNCSLLTSIAIPESVTSIGSDAFRGCSSLTSVTFGENSKLESIGERAFYNCGSLTSIIIPDSVTSIGSDAFSGCSLLTSVNFGENSQLESIGSYAFENCGSLTSIIIPDSVTSIGSDAFSGCGSLESITLPFIGAKAGVTSSDTYQYPLGHIFGTTSYTGGTRVEQSYYSSSTSTTTYSYYYIPSKLKSVTVTGGNILYGAFHNCNMLTSITIGDSVTSIGSYAFYNCSSLTIYCEVASKPNGWGSDWNYSDCPVVWDCNNTDIADDGYIYYVAEDGIRYALKEGKATLVRQFANLSGDIIIPSSINYKGNSYNVTNIDSNAFYNCSSLTSVNFGENSQLESIGTYAFSGCSSLTSITIPDSVTSIGYAAFSECSSLTSVTFKNTQGWWCSTSLSATSGTSISSSYLANSSTAATYLTDTYCEYYWKRS